MRAALALLIVATGCHESGSGGGPDGGGNQLVGECDPAAGSVAVATAAQTTELFDSGCFDSLATELDVVDSIDQWNAAFAACEAKVPAGIDFNTQRAALVHPRCTPVDFRFAAESSTEVVIGVLAGVSGACISDLLVVPLPKAEKPVRVGQCRVDCDDCPPVP
jgi:hypothetical protein